LFETRIIEGKWCLDSFAASNSGSKALMDTKLLHPADRWYHIASVYDGKEFRNYVNGRLQVAGAVSLTPQKDGRTSIGVRINRVDYFKGAIRLARMSRRALSPAEFLAPPKN
jgi:Concanavalin A-like lectin/glucanases superfamily